MMDLEACLPAELRTPPPAITKIAAGLSGAGVYRVAQGDRAFVLKIGDPREPVDAWRHRAAIQRSAAAAGVAPAVVHVDEDRRAIVSAFVVDRSFSVRYFDPRTREAAIQLLGRTLRRVHDLPLPPGATATDPRATLATVAAALGDAIPPFVAHAIDRVRAETPPPSDRAPVLSHNDVNPTNLVDDGERLLLLDWDVAGPNSPFIDLAAIAVFLRMDDDTCRALVAAHDDAPPPAALPAGFTYARRVIAALCGAVFLQLARQAGHAGATDLILADAPSLVDVYAGLRSGALAIASGEGKWAFGLALIKASAEL
jgi:aminoglycoside phosphotransferase (APT) family kinase protein